MLPSGRAVFLATAAWHSVRIDNAMVSGSSTPRSSPAGPDNGTEKL